MKEEIEKFENKLLEALNFKYRDCDHQIKKSIISSNNLIGMYIIEFYDCYRYFRTFPQERLKYLVYLLFDIKIQMYYIQEVDLALYNDFIFSKCKDKEKIKANPYFLLTHLSFDQNLILKSRILWERIMNFVFYMQTGKKLDFKKSRIFKFPCSTKI